MRDLRFAIYDFRFLNELSMCVSPSSSKSAKTLKSEGSSKFQIQSSEPFVSFKFQSLNSQIIRQIKNRKSKIANLKFFCLALCLSFVFQISAQAAIVDKTKKQARDEAARAMREGEFAQAEKLYREMLQQDEADEQARLGLSFSLFKQQRLHGAFDEAAHVLTSNSLSSRANALAGAALLGSGNFRLATDAFQRSLNINRDEALAIAGLAMIDFYENRLDDSIEGLRRAAHLDSNEPDYQFNLAQAAARSERYTEAADAYERFLKIAPRTDMERRARIRGLIDFLRYLGTQRNLYQIPRLKRPVVVPFEIVNNRPVLIVRLNDHQEPLRFVLDTGSGMCVISDATAARFGLSPVARGGRARAVGGEGRFEIVYGFLSSLHLQTDGANGASEVKIEKVPVYIRQFLNNGEQVDGYIGLTSLSKFLTTVDYAKRGLTLERNDARKRSSATMLAQANAQSIDIPIRTTSSGFWSGEVKLEGVEPTLNFIVDTGASISVISSDLMQFAKLEHWMQAGRLRIFGAAGVTEDVPLVLMPRISLGTLSHTNVTAAVLSLDALNETAGFTQTGIIGGNILSRCRLTFDFQRGILRLEPNTPIPSAPAESTPLGITSAKPKKSLP